MNVSALKMSRAATVPSSASERERSNLDTAPARKLASLSNAERDTSNPPHLVLAAKERHVQGEAPFCSGNDRDGGTHLPTSALNSA